MKWKGSNDEGSFDPAPAGTHVARCVRLIDLGTQENDYEGTITFKRQVRITWELPHELMESGEFAGQPYTITKWYTQSLHTKATLRHDLEAWRGRPFTDEELAGFDAKNILGAPCLISVVHTDKGRARVAAVMALTKGTKAPKQINPSVLFSLEPEEFDPELFGNLSEYDRTTIQKSPEYAALMNRKPQPAAKAESAEAAEFDDSDIPF